MLAHNDINELLCLLAGWDRATLVSHLASYPSSFPVDFSHEFLAEQSVDRLRHVLFALCIQNSRMPDVAMIAA